MGRVFCRLSQECVGSSAIRQRETAAATSRQPPLTQPGTSVMFVTELPTPLLERCAPGYLRLRTYRHLPLCRTAKSLADAACHKYG
ncbi:hypothetical protein MTO96_040392 [Rhipicephalus appendiculatus]